MWMTLRNELREVVWLSSVVGGLSVLGVVVLMAANSVLVG